MPFFLAEDLKLYKIQLPQFQSCLRQLGFFKKVYQMR